VKWTKVFPPSRTIVSNKAIAERWHYYQQHAADGEARKNIRRCAHDGRERQYNEISVLEIVVCATCAVSGRVLCAFWGQFPQGLKCK
jgi:hypothetical protein